MQVWFDPDAAWQGFTVSDTGDIDPNTGEVRKYFFDLTEFIGNGKCDCKNFQFQWEPKVRRQNPRAKDRPWFRCKHLRRAFSEAGNMAVQKYIELINQYESQSKEANQENFGETEEPPF